MLEKTQRQTGGCCQGPFNYHALQRVPSADPPRIVLCCARAPKPYETQHAQLLDQTYSASIAGAALVVMRYDDTRPPC